MEISIYERSIHIIQYTIHSYIEVLYLDVNKMEYIPGIVQNIPWRILFPLSVIQIFPRDSDRGRNGGKSGNGGNSHPPWGQHGLAIRGHPRRVHGILLGRVGRRRFNTRKV